MRILPQQRRAPQPDHVHQLRTRPAHPSLRSAIDRKCFDCIHDEAVPGTWREQVAQCACPSCPLWPYRPEPRGGPFADPPRDPETVTPEWLSKGLGEAAVPTRTTAAKKIEQGHGPTGRPGVAP
jgi:hypothetical protein